MPRWGLVVISRIGECVRALILATNVNAVAHYTRWCILWRSKSWFSIPFSGSLGCRCWLPEVVSGILGRRFSIGR
ncbi:hypothetical protein BR93DRAFT_543606 [Coniochaeta sp. PMI_546]|nr:hypothetical protein BR93DRAFT_543606 [Coniochaeta sp. PMI_546]